MGLDPAEVVAHAWGVNGPRWAMLQLASLDALRALRSDAGTGVAPVGLLALNPDGPHAYEVRALGQGYEDPVTGSLNAAAARWLRGRGLVPETYTVSQGRQAGRDGEVHVTDDGTDIWIGGRVTFHVRGTLHLTP